MARSSPPPAYTEKFRIVLIGEDTQLKSQIEHLLYKESAESFVTENDLVVTTSGSFKVVSMPDLSVVHWSLYINDCMALCHPGPHLFILAIDSHNIHEKKVEENITVLQKGFGDDIIKYLVVMVRDFNNYEMLRELKNKLNFTLATVNENMQKQCEEWCSRPPYNYEQSMNRMLMQRREALEKGLKRDQPHPRSQQSSTIKNQQSGSSSSQTDINAPTSAPEHSTDVEQAVVPTSSQTAAGPNHAPPECNTDDSAVVQRFVFNIILIGQTASGKSASANTILSTLLFFKSSKHQFQSEVSSLPVTRTCEVAELKVFGAKIRIIDTPDFFHDQLEVAETQIKKCREFCQPDRCVVLLVMQAGRFTDGERKLLENMEEKMGWKIRENTIILFTHGDNVGTDCTKYVSGQADLRDLLQKCSNRYIMFNNLSKDPQQVMTLIKEIPSYKLIFPKLKSSVSKSPLLFTLSTL